MNIIFISQIIRWILGSGILLTGIVYHSWEAIIFGAILLVSGFFRPRRCINDTCSI